MTARPVRGRSVVRLMGMAAAPLPAQGRARFGQFQLDLDTGDLYHGDRRVRLSGQPIQVLSVLVSRPGSLVTREELCEQLWPDDVFVDFEQGLNAAVKRLRAALRDSAGVPRFIETVPRRGYRFIAPVVWTEPAGIPELEGGRVRPARRAWRWPVLVAIAAALPLALLLGWRALDGKRPLSIDSIASLPSRPLDGGAGANDPGPRRRRGTSVEAYELYLEGRRYWAQRTPESIQTAIAALEDAIAIDPGFALAYAGLSDAYAITASGLPGHERFPIAKAAALKALALDDELAEAHNAYAFVIYKSEFDWEAAETAFRRAIELDPEYALAHQWYGEFLGLLGRFDEAIASLRRATMLEPTSKAPWTDLCGALNRARRYEDAMEACRRALELAPNEWRALSALATAHFGLERDAEGVAHLLRAEILLGRPLNEIRELRAAFRAGGIEGYWRREIEFDLARMDRDLPVPFSEASRLAGRYARLGETDEAIRWLERAFETGEDAPLGLLINPQWDALWVDPRFIELVQRADRLPALGPKPASRNVQK